MCRLASPPPPPPPVADERLLLAVELQDLIAHRLTALAVQAAAAERVLPRAPAAAAATAALAAVHQLARGAMDELARLGRLLDDGPQAAALRPAPALADLAGDPRVDLRLGDAAVPEGVALCAVRAVDTLLAAADATAVVTVTVVVDAVRIEGPATSPEVVASLRLRARPCAGRLVRRGENGLRLDLPFAP